MLVYPNFTSFYYIFDKFLKKKQFKFFLQILQTNIRLLVNPKSKTTRKKNQSFELFQFAVQCMKPFLDIPHQSDLKTIVNGVSKVWTPNCFNFCLWKRPILLSFQITQNYRKYLEKIKKKWSETGKGYLLQFFRNHHECSNLHL